MYMEISTGMAIVVALMVVAIIFLTSVLMTMYRKAGPHEALIVYGFRGTRVVKGHGTIILPMIETWHQLSLELMSFDVAPTQDLYTKQGVAVTVEAVAQIKVKSDLESIQTAAEQFLTKTPDQRESLIRLVMEGHLRGIIGQLTVEQIVKEPEMVGERMRSTCADDMTKMGLEVVSFTIKEVRDKNEYIVNMGRPDVAGIKRDADVAAAEADRDTAIKRAEATRASAIARAQADQERVLAETLSQAKQAEAQRDLDIKKANYLETVKKQQAQADKAYEIQTNVMQQQVEAEGRASAIRAQGEAEAEIIFKKGDAEARAMSVKAAAFQEYNQAAVVDKLITGLPEIVKALAAPLANVDKITIVSTGNGDTAGLNKITGDITKMAAQVPALFESLSGMPLSELLGKVRKIGDKAPKPEEK